MERQAFSRQPARAVLVDMHRPMDASTCRMVHQALSNILMLLAHLNGPVRVPLLSISLLQSYTECLYPLQNVKGNHTRLLTAMEEMKTSVFGLLSRTLNNSRSSLVEGIQEALVQFSRLNQSLKQAAGSATTTGHPSQIEVTILTARSPSHVRRCVEHSVDTLELEHLKKLSVVCITDPSKLIEQGRLEEEDEDQGMYSQLPPSPSELSMSLLDVSSIDNDVLSLQSYLKTWLHDCGTDSEHVHLSLPAPSADTTGSGRLVIKCDLYDRMIPVNALPPPLSKNFSLSTGSVPTTTSASSSGARATALIIPLPVYKLKIIGTYSSSGVCESVLYGCPMVVKPTACWTLDWEELETNRQHFMALCQQLTDRDQVLLAACTETTSLSTSSSSISSQAAGVGHYLLLPSSSSLLIKPVVVNELLLPVETTGEGDKPTPDAMDSIAASLDQLEPRQTYNPLLVSSRINELLATSGVRKGGQLSRVAPKRKTPALPDSAGRGGGAKNLGVKRTRVSRGGFVYGGGTLR